MCPFHGVKGAYGVATRCAARTPDPAPLNTSCFQLSGRRARLHGWSPQVRAPEPSRSRGHERRKSSAKTFLVYLCLALNASKLKSVQAGGTTRPTNRKDGRQ